LANTAEPNGGLIFVAPRSQKFAIIGDKAINERRGEHFWSEVAESMTAHFQKAGTRLAEHFPRRTDDKNELPDAVERG
jgi:uncharacterized membrane protein